MCQIEDLKTAGEYFEWRIVGMVETSMLASIREIMGWESMDVNDYSVERREGAQKLYGKYRRLLITQMCLC